MAIEKLGPYRLDKLLGRGGMGAVYVGIDDVTGERAAVKVLAAHLADNPDFRERFAAEVETLKKLKHPNIVQLLAYGQEEDHLFYVMELIDGCSLQDEIQRRRRFDWREVAKIGVDICKALKHAHDSGVIHRDLKPANLLIDSQDQVKLTDFGIAKLYGGTQITAAGGVLGTADYMSPEQAEGKPVTARSDLYSLGSVLYALLVGHPPFAAKTMAEVIHGLRFDKPIAVSRINPNVPAEFESIILQLLEKDPAKRIASAFAVGNFLRAMEHALSIETQVGASIDEGPIAPLPTPTPKANVTSHGALLDATMSTGVQSSTGGETVDLSYVKDEDEYRLSGVVGVTSATAGSIGIHRQATVVPAAEVAPLEPKSRFITMAEEEATRRKRRTDEDEGPPLWTIFSAMAVLACVVVGIFWYAFAPASADRLFSQISAAAAKNEPDSLGSVSPQIVEFLERFPDDPRTAEISEYNNTLELSRLQRRFDFISRSGKHESLSAAEQAYLDAVRTSDHDPQRALGMFQAIIALFNETEESETTDQARIRRLSVELATRQIEALEKTLQETTASYQKTIAARLDNADKIRAESPREAQAIYDGVVNLYSDKLWAEDLVKRAKAAQSRETKPQSFPM